VVAGKNVDLVAPAHTLTFRSGFFDTIISTEALEHDLHWVDTLRNWLSHVGEWRALRAHLCRQGRAEHGRSAASQSAPGLPWSWYYRNLDECDIRMAFGNVETMFQRVHVRTQRRDL